MVCPSCTYSEDALKVAKKLRLAIEAMVEPVRITASVGLAEVMPQRPRTDSISLADKALFDAKQGGRSCVCFRE